MARFYEGLTREAIDLDTLFERVASIKAPELSDAYMDECAVHLAALGNNKDLIWQHLRKCDGLAGWNRSFSSPQSFILGSSDEVSVRANIWLPRRNSAVSEYERDLYAYDLAHNHDFRFLSVGYFGPGYETDLYTFDPESADGTPGRRVELAGHRRERLGPGRIIYYEQYRDVHIQHEPEAVSISVNLLFKHEERRRDQILFNVKEPRVVGVQRLTENSRIMAALEASTFFADEETLRILERYANHSVTRIAEFAKSARLRLAATEDRE
jgi:hypothetical protein